MDDAFGHWLAGFSDGESAFTIARVSSRNGNPHNKTWPTCSYQLHLRADDSAVLMTIRDTLGFGGIQPRSRPNPMRPGENPSVRYSVHRIGDCLKLVEIFHRYPLRAKKQAQFLVWANAVHEMGKGRDRDDAFIDECRAKLASLRKFSEPKDWATLTVLNPAALRHKRDYGLAPLCLCGCGATCHILSNSLSHPHPVNPNYSSFARGHHRRVKT